MPIYYRERGANVVFGLGDVAVSAGHTKDGIPVVVFDAEQEIGSNITEPVSHEHAVALVFLDRRPLAGIREALGHLLDTWPQEAGDQLWVADGEPKGEKP